MRTALIRTMATLATLATLGLLAALLSPAALAQPGLSVSPAEGPPGTTFAIQGTGFVPNSSVLCAASDPNQKEVVAALIQITPNGVLQAAVESTGYAPGRYTVVASSPDRAQRFASITFTITPGAAPRTGEGGTAGAGPAPLLAGLALAALAALAGLGAAVVGRRRAA